LRESEHMAREKTSKEKTAQIERFRAKVRELTDAGQLDPAEADAALDKLVSDQGRRGPR
jgi:Spy/CpxP family protein refolding chaperone